MHWKLKHGESSDYLQDQERNVRGYLAHWDSKQNQNRCKIYVCVLTATKFGLTYLVLWHRKDWYVGIKLSEEPSDSTFREKNHMASYPKGP